MNKVVKTRHHETRVYQNIKKKDLDDPKFDVCAGKGVNPETSCVFLQTFKNH